MLSGRLCGRLAATGTPAVPTKAGPCSATGPARGRCYPLPDALNYSEVSGTLVCGQGFS
jgi:hypothetical protein